MIIHYYFIILQSFLVILSSTHNHSFIIVIFNKIQFEQKRTSYSVTLATSHLNNQNSYFHIFYDLLRRSASNIVKRKQILNETNSIRKNINNTKIVQIDNHSRIKRNFIRKNKNPIYNDDDRKYSENVHDNIQEDKQAVDNEYYSPIEKNSFMNNRLYRDNVHRLYHIYPNQERNTDKRFMQNNEQLLNFDRLANDYNLNDDFHRHIYKINDDNSHISKKQRNHYDYLERQDQLETDDDI